MSQQQKPERVVSTQLEDLSHNYAYMSIDQMQQQEQQMPPMVDIKTSSVNLILTTSTGTRTTATITSTSKCTEYPDYVNYAPVVVHMNEVEKSNTYLSKLNSSPNTKCWGTIEQTAAYNDLNNPQQKREHPDTRYIVTEIQQVIFYFELTKIYSTGSDVIKAHPNLR
jgi:hypothetical protein